MFVEYIKDLRLSRGISQKSLAAKLYIAPCTLSHYESGKRMVPHQTYEKILELLDYKINVYDLRTGKQLNKKDFISYYE